MGSVFLLLGSFSELSEMPFGAADGSKEVGTDAARAVFGDTFSFVRRITDSFGNVTYMYGYGEKNLYLYAEGAIEYRTTVSGGVVTGLRREGIDPGTYTPGENRAAASPANVIANNSNHIYNILKGSVLAPASDEAFDFAAKAVRSLAPGYYADPSRKLLVPAWVLKASGGEMFYFDLYEGTPLGYTR